MGHSVKEEYFSGQGVVMIATRDVSGNPTGFRPLGNCPAVAIKNATTVLEHKESTTGQRGTDKRLTTEVKVGIEITLENYNSENIALVTRGTKTAKTGATVTAEAVTAYAGKISALAHMKVSAVTVEMGVTPLVAFVDEATAWDYKLNAEAGSIQFNSATGLDGSGAPPNITYTLGEKDVTVDYTYATQVEVDAFNTGNTELYLRFEGLNTAEEDSPVVIEVFKFSVDPTQDFSMISDQIQSFVLQGSVLKDALRGTGSQYYKVTKIDR
jgi:hypothetical protein